MRNLSKNWTGQKIPKSSHSESYSSQLSSNQELSIYVFPHCIILCACWRHSISQSPHPGERQLFLKDCSCYLRDFCLSRWPCKGWYSHTFRWLRDWQVRSNHDNFFHVKPCLCWGNVHIWIHAIRGLPHFQAWRNLQYTSGSLTPCHPLSLSTKKSQPDSLAVWLPWWSSG